MATDPMEDTNETVYEAAWRAYKAAPRAVANGPSRSAVRAAVDAAFAARVRLQSGAQLDIVDPVTNLQSVDLGPGVKAIAAERERQLQAEGFTRDGDRQYRRGELAGAATAYAQVAAMDLYCGTRGYIAGLPPPSIWPWAPEWWKPVDTRRDLVRAGALIAAQIDLIDSQVRTTDAP